MAPPTCGRCGSLELFFLSKGMQRAWVAEEGMQWSWKGNLAYWRLCLPCHREVWPEDRRNPNGSSRPWSWLVGRRLVCGSQRSGKVSMVVGDFYLTQPASQPASQPQAFVYGGPLVQNNYRTTTEQLQNNLQNNYRTTHKNCLSSIFVVNKRFVLF
jgi:hypothetical protein